MKVNCLTLLAVIIVLSASVARAEGPAATALAAEGQAAPAQPAAAPAQPAGDVATYYDDSDPVRDFILRAGVWGVHSSGSPYLVGEYQDLQSSPFWNADGIFSNGDRTVDFTVTGSDNESSDARLRAYLGPQLSVDLQYERFPHLLQPHNYAGWIVGTPPPPLHGTNQADPSLPANPITNVNLFVDENRSPNQTYALRVQEFKANFKGNLTENLKWRLNVFGIDKEGNRQVNTVAHCYQDMSVSNPSTIPPSTLRNQCHATTQSQHIDWQTTQFEPVLEARLNSYTALEYSHLIRTLQVNDSLTTADYNRAATAGYATTSGGLDGVAGYAFVPDNQTQIDRLKFSTQFGCDTNAYVLGYVGNNKNNLRDFQRDFNGADLRITNSSLDALTVTGYGKYYRENTGEPGTALDARYPSMASAYREPNLSLIDEPVNRESHAFGVDGRWRPFKDECGTLRSRMSLVGGYEYATLRREFAEYELTTAGTGRFVSGGEFYQPDTNRNTFVAGVEERWSACFDTYLRYKYIASKYPLYGITGEVNNSVDHAVNSNLPTQENRVELGCTWTPTDTLMVNATLYVENAMSDAPYANWTSNSLPFVVSSCWAPTCDWSLSLGFAEMDSWINQDVSLAQLSPTSTPVEDALNVPWKYTGVADVFNVGSRYALTRKLILTGDFELVRGTNASYAAVNPALSSPQPNPAIAPYDIGQYSLVEMRSYRFGLGADYLIRPRVTTYLRYNYYDYQDVATGLTSGQANMFLGGVSATF